jgi:hypothetical protein
MIGFESWMPPARELDSNNCHVERSENTQLLPPVTRFGLFQRAVLDSVYKCRVQLLKWLGSSLRSE